MLFMAQWEPALPSFETIDALVDSLQAAGLATSLAEVMAAVRPVILFRRHQVADTRLSQGASKLGGNPMLPAGFTWPHRRAYANAPRLAAACRKLGAQLAQSTADRRAERLSRPLRPGERTIEAAEVDAVVAEYDLIADALARPFPLAFVAQLDLASLSAQAGFEPLLPRTGTLSFFCDATPYGSGEAVAVWTDKSGLPTEPPADLLTYYAAHCTKSSAPWHELTQTEALLPFSAVDLPDNRLEAPAVEEWLADLESYTPPAISADGAQGVFGDKLRGYARGLATELAQTPGGKAMPRHLFTWGAEYQHDTRLIPVDELSDGQASLMIREKDLTSRRFQKARTSIQFT